MLIILYSILLSLNVLLNQVQLIWVTKLCCFGICETPWTILPESWNIHRYKPSIFVYRFMCNLYIVRKRLSLAGMIIHFKILLQLNYFLCSSHPQLQNISLKTQHWQRWSKLNNHHKNIKILYKSYLCLSIIIICLERKQIYNW